MISVIAPKLSSVRRVKQTAAVAPALVDLDSRRTGGPRYVEREPKAKPPKEGKVYKTASPSAHKVLTHKTPMAAILAQEKKKVSKKGSSGVAHDVSRALGTMTIAKMAAAVRKAEVEAELMQKLSTQHKAKVDSMGGGTGKQNPFARAHL